MTFEETARDMMYQRAMFDNMIDAVMEAIKAAPENEPMAQRWNDKVEDYPPMMKNILRLTVKRHALEYIERECPQAWFKPAFEDKAEVAPETHNGAEVFLRN